MENAGQWLIRTADNLVAGPYSRDQVRQLIRDGQLGLDDEVCPANGYWFFLHERDEVRDLLAVEVPKAGGSGDDEEDTETEIVVSTEGRAPLSAEPSSDAVALPELESTPELTPEEQTAILSNAALRRFQPKKKEQPLRRPMPGVGPALILGQVERPSFWRGFAWVLVAGIALVVYAVLRIIRLS